MKKILIVILLAFVLVGCHDRNEDPFVIDYPIMKNVEHVYVKTNYTTALNLILDGTGVLLFAFDSNLYDCPYCQTVVPILNEAAIESGWDSIYYLDIYKMRAENTSEYRLLVGYIESQVQDLLVRNEQKTLVVPDVYFIKEGQIMGHHIATLYEDERFIYDLNETQRLTLKNIYLDLFSRIE